VNDTRNSWCSKPTVLRHILTTPQLLEQFAYFDEFGDIHWKPGVVHARMVEIYHLQMDIFMLILSHSEHPLEGPRFRPTLYSTYLEAMCAMSSFYLTSVPSEDPSIKPVMQPSKIEP
jgi:hypothetical protein